MYPTSGLSPQRHGSRPERVTVARRRNGRRGHCRGRPSGLSAAIRLKQLEVKTGNELRVAILEKRSEIGARISSGAVIERSALDALFPDWHSRYPDLPLAQPVTSSGMRFLIEEYSIPIPHPPQMNSKGNFAAGLGGIAEELGVEVYPNFAAAQFLLPPSLDAEDAQGRKVRSMQGVVTGLTRTHTNGPRFEPGVAFHMGHLLTEGAPGSFSKQVVAMYDLRNGKEVQTYGFGIKGCGVSVRGSMSLVCKVLHTLSPRAPTAADASTKWLTVSSAGFVVGLDYKDRYLEPYREFQRTNHYPHFRALLAGGTRLAYGAHALTDGRLQSLPRLDF
ncbi:hypothetical protein K438DRAFT_1754313 [Mycena galopus ATCC 62051]|nr:hypothetical protein K438DRAFT_1754313 [Mycena galopus ATCC 62051]